MADQAHRRTEDAIARARTIARRIGRRLDKQAAAAIERFCADTSLRYDLPELCIAQEAWDHIERAGTMTRLVFAHPAILKAIPNASLHYRGLALLSLKRVQEIAGDVTAWERTPATARVRDDKALRVCRLYNAVVSSIVMDNTDWTLNDGYRNVLATVGITEDGAIRNIIGQEAESAIKERLLAWVRDNALLQDASAVVADRQWQLVGNATMAFSSEPDISFTKAGCLSVLIEVKGGKDPAGALERLGAVKKTFDEAPAGCKNFLVVGVVTPTMRERLSDMRMEKDFDIDSLLHNETAWRVFTNEIFHHALRIAPEQ